MRYVANPPHPHLQGGGSKGTVKGHVTQAVPTDEVAND